MTTEEAITRSRDGDLAAYELVVRGFQGRLRAFIATYCPARESIDEIAQRTFVWAYQHLDRYTPGTRFFAWLKAIARHQLLADLEVQKREARGRQRYLAFLQATACHDELLCSENPSELAEALRTCLDELLPEERELVTRRYESRVPLEQIARDLGRAGGALRVALFRIRQGLRQCVEGKRAEARL